MVLLLLPLALVLMIVAIALLASAPRVLPAGVCLCGYSLRGLPERGVCPECGHAFNQRTWQHLLPEWGSPREHAALYLVPAAAGLVGALVCTALSPWHSGLLVIFALAAGVGPVAPALVLVWLSKRRVTREMAWTICIAGFLPGLVLAAALFIASANSSDAQAGIGIVFAPVIGGAVSGTLGGFFGCIAAMQQSRRHRDLLRARRPAAPQSPPP